MDEILYTFSSTTTELDSYLYLGISALILCIGLFYYSYKNNKKLLLLFSGFIGIIALGTALFSGLTSHKLGDIQLYKDGIIIQNKTFDFKDIKMIKIENIDQLSKYPIHRDGNPIIIDSSQLLLIESRKHGFHLISNIHYDINSIYNKLEILLKDWRERNDIKAPR